MPLPQETQDELCQLAMLLDEAQREESDAKAARILMEGKIEALVASAIALPSIGQRTVQANAIKICVERGFNYKIDVDGINAACKVAELPPPIKTTTSTKLDAKGYAWYRANHPKIHAGIAKHVTATPKKTSVKVTK